MNEHPARTSAAAVASLVLGIVSMVLLGFIAGIPAVICGHVSLSRMKRLLLHLLSFLVCFPAFAGEPSVFRMPRDRNMYFRSYFLSGSAYFQFRTNGAYRQINREHLFVEESDHGTWEQAESGELTLVSQEHYRNIECEPLSIFMWHTQAIERLPWVKVQINNLIASSTNLAFTKDQIEGIEKYGYKNCLSRISVHSLQPVPRGKLEELVAHIDRFLNDSTKTHFHATPMTYKDQTFLLWRDAQARPNRHLPAIKRLIDENEPGSEPDYIFTSISEAVFLKESGKTQEFIFHPEMNDRVQQPKGKAGNPAAGDGK